MPPLDELKNNPFETFTSMVKLSPEITDAKTLVQALTEAFGMTEEEVNVLYPGLSTHTREVMVKINGREIDIFCLELKDPSVLNVSRPVLEVLLDTFPVISSYRFLVTDDGRLQRDNTTLSLGLHPLDTLTGNWGPRDPEAWACDDEGWITDATISPYENTTVESIAALRSLLELEYLLNL